jgi:sirohydrochlorin ferrochelatase
MTTNSCIFLIDNGSLRADAVLALRVLAKQLAERVGGAIEPVSLLHSSKVSPAELGGVQAEVVKTALARLIEAGLRHFVFVPLFLGPSRAVSGYLPELIAQAKELTPDLQVVVADTLAGADVDDPDARLADILAAHVRQTIQTAGLSAPCVALVDHGTPEKAVNCVRNAVAQQLEQRLVGEVTAVAACSMERREGPEYDFNEPLLERVGALDGWRDSEVVVALFFLLPGRHAGAAGDVAQICEDLVEQQTLKSVVRTPLLGGHPLLIDILVDRLNAALQTTSFQEGSGGQRD